MSTPLNIHWMHYAMDINEYLRELRLTPLPLRRELEIKLEASEQMQRAGHPRAEEHIIDLRQCLLLLDAIERRVKGGEAKK